MVNSMLWAFEQRELLMEFYERVYGARLHAAYYRVGGVHQDMPAGMADDLLKWIDQFPKFIDDMETLLRKTAFSNNVVLISELFPQRMRWRGDLRARCSVARALRGICGKSQPYECYAELDFDIPIGKNGDCYDRYLIRMEEMRQSVRIMKQCIHKLNAPDGKGPVVVADNKVAPPRRGDMKRSMEALIHHFKLYTEGVHVPAGEVYAAVEAPKGEFGVYLVADGTNKPYKCKIRAPGFAHLQAMDHICRGHLLADVSAILGSLDIVFGEVDR